jgi:hypothetical protein
MRYLGYFGLGPQEIGPMLHRYYVVPVWKFQQYVPNPNIVAYRVQDFLPGSWVIALYFEANVFVLGLRMPIRKLLRGESLAGHEHFVFAFVAQDTLDEQHLYVLSLFYLCPYVARTFYPLFVLLICRCRLHANPHSHNGCSRPDTYILSILAADSLPTEA